MRKVLITLLALVILSSLLMAVPARPGFRMFTQPDGSKVALELKGDEHFHFARTEDNHSVIKDAEGWWTYAQKIDGLLLPTFFIVGKDECPFPKGLRPDANAVADLPVNKYRQINWGKLDIDIYSKGAREDKKVLVVLGAFDDSTYFGTDRPANWDTQKWTVAAGFKSAHPDSGGIAHDSIYWDWVFFDSNNPGSFKTYFAEVSFGKWICSGNVIGPVSSGNTYGSYGDGAELTYMQDCIDMANGRMRLHGDDFDNYDGDGDGEVAHYINCRCGGEQASTGDPADMWACKYTTTVGTSGVSIVRNPVNAGELTSQDITRNPLLDPEYVRSRTMGIGVYCHESWHAFNAPDLYTYDYNATPAGAWSLMDGGAWAGDGIQSGCAPPRPGSIIEYNIPGYPDNGSDGFFEPSWITNVNTNGRYPVIGLGLPISYGGPRMYMLQNTNFNGTGEYFIIENRCNYGIFEGNLPEHGLIISHYDTNPNITGRYNDGPQGDANKWFRYWIEQEGFDPIVHNQHADTISRNENVAAYRAGDADEFTNLTSAAANQNGSTTLSLWVETPFRGGV